MAQIPFRCNLSAANFPMVTEFGGRTIVIAQYDQNFSRQQSFSGTDADRDVGIPQAYYLHNCLPTAQGFQSVAYKKVVPGPVGSPVTDLSVMIPIKDPSEHKGYLALSKTGRGFMMKSGDSGWTEITSQLGGWTGGPVSYAYANGFTYVDFKLWNTYKVDVLNRQLNAVALSGLTSSLVQGLCSSSNYLLAWDSTTIYWSSASNPEDFVPSLTTGAGSGTPQDINGVIIAVLPTASGFAVYTSTNIIIASYSGNVRYPWIFRQAPNSGGIMDIEHVTTDADGGANYAWTSSGLLKVAPQGCTPVFPDASDFLAGRIFEDYDDATDILTTTYLTDPLQIKLQFIGSRWLVISYGMTSLTHALVYDSAMKRWGKLKIAHADCFEVVNQMDKAIPWSGLYPNPWSFYVGTAWNALLTSTDTAAFAKRTIGFLAANGDVQLATMDYGDTSAAAVLMLGKYQISRTRLTGIEQIDVETVQQGNQNFSVLIRPSLNGKDLDAPVTPYAMPVQANSRTRQYMAHNFATNHSILFKGSFNLVSVELTMTRHGDR